MKKALIASTALVLSAGVAAADVTISGYGRTGIDYQENRANDENEAQIVSRLRMNIDAATSTDQGVEFGARFRMQWDQGSGTRGDGGTVNAGQLWVKSNGLKVSVGNVGGAFDDAPLIYDPEVGVYDRSFGDPSGNFFFYESSKYANVDRVGVNVAYSMGAFSGELSYIDPDQSGLNEGGDLQEEIALFVAYKTDMWSAAAAMAKDGAGIDGNDNYFIGGAYNFNERGTVGLNWIDNGENGSGEDLGKTITLYGNYEVMPLTTVEAYIAKNDRDSNDTDVAYGIGANYDLGGARLSGALERGYDENMRADMGVRFDF